MATRELALQHPSLAAPPSIETPSLPREFGRGIKEAVTQIFTGTKTATQKYQAQLEQYKNDSQHGPVIAQTKKVGGRVVDRDEFIEAPFSAFQPNSRKKISQVGFDLSTYDQITSEHLSQAIDKYKKATKPAETAAATPSTASLENELTALHQQLANLENWLDNTQFGKAVVKIFGKRQERLDTKKAMMIARHISREEKGKNNAQTMYEVEALILEASKLTSWLGAISKAVTHTMISTITYDMVYKPLLKGWLGKGIKEAWTFSIDKIIGKKKAGKMTGVSLQELAGRLEELFLKDEHGFGVRSGNITQQRIREAFVGGTEFSLKLHLFPYLLSQLPSIGSIINPAEINQLFISLHMAMGSKHSVETTAKKLKEAKSPIEKAGILLVASASGLLYGFARKVSPVLFDGPMGGANLAVMTDTFFNQLLGGFGELIQQSKGEFQESRFTKWLHTIQAGIAGYNAGHSVLSLGNMITSVIETGSVNPLAHVKSEEQLIKLIEEHQEYLFGKGGGVFGKILNAENQLHHKIVGKITQVFTRADRTNTPPTLEQQAQEAKQEIPPIVMEIGDSTYMIQTDGKQQVKDMVKIDKNGRVSLYDGEKFVNPLEQEKSQTQKNSPEQQELKSGSLATTESENETETATNTEPEFGPEIEQELIQEAERLTRAVHDYFISDPEGKWSLIRLDLLPGETLEQKITRLVSGEIDDLPEAIANLTGSDIKNLTPEQIEQLAGDDRVLEAQFHRDFIQPIVEQARQAGIPSEILIQRLTEVFESNLVTDGNSNLSMGEIHHDSLMQFLLRPVNEEGVGATPPPTLTFFTDERPAVFRDQDQVHLTIKPGESLLGNLRQDLPEQAVIGIYSGLLRGELQLFVQTNQGLTTVASLDLIPANSQLIIRANSKESASLFDSVASLQNSAELLANQGYSKPRTPINLDEELVFYEGGFRPRTELEDAPFEQTESDFSPTCPFSFKIDGEEEMILEPATTSIEPDYSETPASLTDHNYDVPWYGFNNEAIGLRQSTQDGALSIIPLGEVPVGGSVSELMSRVFVSQEEGAPNTWQVLAQIQEAAQSGNSSNFALVVVDKNTGEIIRTVNPNLVRPGELLAIIDLNQTLDVPEYDGYLPQEPEPYIATNFAFDPADPQQTFQKRVVLQQIEALASQRVSSVDLSNAEIYRPETAEDEFTAKMVIVSDNHELHYDPITGELIIYETSPTEPRLISYKPPFKLDHQVDLPATLINNINKIVSQENLVSDWSKITEAIAQAVSTRSVPIPDGFYSLFQSLSQEYPELQDTNIEQAWVAAVQNSLFDASTQPANADHQETTLNISYYQVLKALGLDPANSLAKDGCLLTPSIPALLANQTKLIAQELGVDPENIVMAPGENPSQVRACVIPDAIDEIVPPIDSLQPEMLFLVQNEKGELIPTSQPQPEDNIVEIAQMQSGSTDNIFIFTQTTQAFVEIGGKRIAVDPNHPGALQGKLVVNPTTLECFIESVDETDQSDSPEIEHVRTLEPIHQGCPIEVDTIHPTAKSLLAARLMHSAVDQLAQEGNEVAHNYQTGLISIAADGEQQRFFSIFPSATSQELFVTFEGQLVFFDQSSSTLSAVRINQTGEVEEVVANRTMSLTSFLEHFDLSVATKNDQPILHNGEMVFVNSQGLAVVLSPDGPVVLGSADQNNVNLITSSALTQSPEVFLESFNTVELTQIQATKDAELLRQQFNASQNLSINPVIDAQGNIHHQGNVYQATIFYDSQGSPIFLRPEDNTHHRFTKDSIEQVDTTQESLFTQNSLLTRRSLSPAQIDDRTVNIGIGKWQTKITLIDHPDGNLIHALTGLPILTNNQGEWFIQTATGLQLIGDPSNAVTHGIVQFQEANNSSRPLTLEESRSVIDAETNLPPLDFKQRTTILLAKVDQSLANILRTNSYGNILKERVPSFDNLRLLLDQNSSTIPPQLLETMIASEERAAFRNKAGFSSWAIVRAVVDSIKGGEFGAGGGGGTIAMQVARNLLLDDRSRSIIRKWNEINLGAQLASVFTQEELINLYYRTSNYGDGQTLGIEAGARKLFGVSADHLSQAQRVMLTVVPQVPGRYNFGSFSNAKAWVERSLITVEQQQSIGLITDNEARQLQAEIEAMLPNNWQLIAGQLNRGIIDQDTAERVWQEHRQMMVSANIDDQQAQLQVNTVALVARTSDPDESQKQATTEHDQPERLLASAKLNALSPLTNEAEESPWTEPPTVQETRIPITYVEQFNDSIAGASLREDTASSFQTFLQNQDLLLEQVGLNDDAYFSINTNLSRVAHDGTYSFTITNQNEAVGVMYAVKQPNSDEWAVLSVIGQDSQRQISFTDLRPEIAKTGATGYPDSDPDNGLRKLTSGKATVMLHQLGTKDVEGGVPPFSADGQIDTQLLFNQILKDQWGSQYNVAIHVDLEGKIHYYMLNDFNRLTGGAEPGHNAQVIHALVVWDETEDLSPQQMNNITLAVNQLIANLDANADIIDPGKVNAHHEIDATGCMTTFKTPASVDSIVRVYQERLEPFYPGLANSPDQITELMANLLETEQGTITYLDLMRLGAVLGKDELTQLAVEKAVVVANPQEQVPAPQAPTEPEQTFVETLVVPVKNNEGESNTYPRSGVVFESTPDENGNRTGRMSTNYLEEIENKWAVISYSQDTGEPEFVFNAERNAVGKLINSSIVVEQFHQVVEDEHGNVAFVTPFDIHSMEHNLSSADDDTLFINAQGKVFRLVQDGNRPLVEEAGEVIYVPGGTAIIAPPDLDGDRENMVFGTTPQEMAISSLLNAGQVSPQQTELGTDEGNPNIAAQIAESLEAQDDILPEHLRYQDPETLSRILNDHSIPNRGISLRPNAQGREVFENVLRAVVENRGESMVVWIDSDKAQAEVIDHSGGQAIIRDTNSTAVTVLRVETVGDTEYVFFEIPSGVGGRTTPVRSALPWDDFVHSAEVAGSTIRAAVVGQDAVNAIDPSLEHRLRETEVNQTDPEHQIAVGLVDNWRWLATDKELMSQTTIDPEIQNYAETALRAVLPRTRSGSNTPPNVFGVFIESDVNSPDSSARVIADFSLVRDGDEIRSTEKNNNHTYLGPPGSTMKPFTLLMYLANGGSANTLIKAGRSILLEGQPIDDHNPRAPANLTATRIVELSNNPGTLRMVIEVGRIALRQSGLPFTEQDAINAGGQILNEYLSQTGLFDSDEYHTLSGASTGPMRVDDETTIESQGGFSVLTGMGQGGANITNWLLARGFIPFAHKGQEVNLEFMQDDESSIGVSFPGAEPEHFEIIERTLRNAAKPNTGTTRAFVGAKNYIVFGKTGTAETGGPFSTSLFAGYAREVDRNGRYTGKVVTFSVQIPEGGEGEAARFVREMLDKIFQHTPQPVVNPPRVVTPPSSPTTPPEEPVIPEDLPHDLN